MKTFAPALLILVMSTALPCLAQSVAEQQDAEVIENLRAAGSDLAKPHEVEFFFYFPSEERAESAAKELASASYEVIAIERAQEGAAWHVQAQRSRLHS